MSTRHMVVFMLINIVYSKIIIEDIRTLALKILYSTSNSTKNTVVSTLPLQFSLCKLASVARGRAKAELLTALGLSDDSMVEGFYGKFKDMFTLPMRTDLIYINKIYLDYNHNYDVIFAQNSTSQYGVHVDKAHFNTPRSAVSYINKAIASATYRRIENVLAPGDITKFTSLLLITAEHFKGTWEEQFDFGSSRIRPFKYLNNTMVTIPMMERMQSYQLYDAKDFRVVTIRLMHPGWSMTFVQPDFLSVDKVLKKMVDDPNFLKKVRDQMSFQHLKLVLPRMKIKSQIDLDEVLKRMGIQGIFNDKSTDLNAILKEGVNASNVHVSKVRQQLFLEMDEFGISRTSGSMTTPKAREPPGTLEVALDRPFYFTVNLHLSYSQMSSSDIYEMFSGVFYGPE